MPLKEGSSEQAFNYNVEELQHTYKVKGKIGTTKPRSKEHARRIALAIAFDIKRKGKKKKGGK